MAKATEEKSDGLEIISIGKLYSGPWEKKYWSSSRGKDRYPYPVGFKALRTQNGIMYRMEISEGLKGPSFMISSADGLSCSGQTPDIAWDSFQKKGFSRIKLWHGKRFSCKIDGMEFFGFKNAFVQRLLRELVANIGGSAERNLLPSGICNKDSETRDPIEQSDLSICPDLPPYSIKPRVTGKRSRKDKYVVRLKKVSSQNVEHNADASNIGQSSQGNHNDRCPSLIPASNEDDQFEKKAGALLRSEKVEPMIEEEKLLVSVEKNLQLNCFDLTNHLKFVGSCDQEESKITSFSSHTVVEGNGNSTKDKTSIDRSQDSPEAQLNCLVKEDEDEERTGQFNMKITNDSELCAPDTLDHSIEDDVGTPNSNTSSDKAENDSLGQDIAKSMMTLLLPRALPLLKTFSRRKKKNSKKSTIVPKVENEKTEDVPSPVREHNKASYMNRKTISAHISGATDECVGHLESVVPDSFDNDDVVNPLTKKLPRVVADQSLLGPETCCSKTIMYAEAEAPACHSEASDSRTSSHSQTLLVFNQETSIDDNSKTSLNRKFPNKRDTYTNPGKNPFCAGNQSAQENIKILTDHIEGIFDPANSCQEQSETYATKELPQDKDFADFDMSTPCLQIQKVNFSSDVAQKMEVKDGSNMNNHVNWKQKSELENVLNPIACYDYSMPILTVLLSTIGNDIYLCLLCGNLEQEEKILFVHSARINGEKTGCPSLIGHSSIILPFLKNSFGRNIALDSPGLQFTPDAQALVLVNSIKMPCCREGKIHCPCLSCTSDGLEGNAVKIVHVKVGYVSVVTKMITEQTVHSVLVCAPNYLVAADESGRLYLWLMNSRWSAQIEECYLSVPDDMPSCLIELKKIPNSAALIVGHNGFGDFGLWDVDKRIFLSKFSAPSTSISKCVPISLFQWQRKGSVPADCSPQGLINEILDTTKIWSSGSREKQLALPIDGEDVATWLLISTISDPDTEYGHQSGDWPSNSGGCWRLALLVKDMVIMGSPLDLRAAAIGASAGYGIIGRCDGLVYMWELSTGVKLGSLHRFRGEVSCIATDSSNSGALAIASSKGQLLLYMHS